MKTIIIGFSKGGTFLGSLIRFCTRSPISHVYIRIPLESDPTLSLVFHAAGLNVHYVNFDNFLPHQKEIISEWEIQLTDEEWTRARTQRFQEAGKPYGFKELVGYAVPVFGALLGKKWKNPLSDGDSTHVCVSIAAKQINLDSAILESTLPHELEEVVAKMSNAKRIR
jgi:hypothetical protein